MPDIREITYGQALFEAIRQEMEADSSVFVAGLGVDDPLGQYGTTKDLHKLFGADRNFDTPLSEDAMTGIAVGAALAGKRPIAVHQRMDFLMLCMNQLVNMAAKYHYMSDGKLSVPMVVRTSIGRSWGQGPQHSQAPYPMFMQVPGLKVVAPTTPYDAKGLMTAAIRDNNPVIFIEHRMLFGNGGHVPAESYELPLGKARILREGADVTLVGVSYTVTDCLRAARLLAEVGIKAEVIDMVSLSPMDTDTLVRSAQKTGRLLFVENSWTMCGAGAEVLATLAERGLAREIQTKRMGYAPTTCPTVRCLEDIYYPSPTTVARAAADMCGYDDGWQPEAPHRKEIEEFKGPF